jgi:hypothetical protein
MALFLFFYAHARSSFHVVSYNQLQQLVMMAPIQRKKERYTIIYRDVGD